MTFGTPRHTLVPNEWTRICASEDENVTVENFGVGAYQTVQIIAGPTPPGSDADITQFRTVRPQASQTFTNLDEGTVLWARSSEAVVIEVMTG